MKKKENAQTLGGEESGWQKVLLASGVAFAANSDAKAIEQAIVHAGEEESIFACEFISAINIDQMQVYFFV